MEFLLPILIISTHLANPSEASLSLSPERHDYNLLIAENFTTEWILRNTNHSQIASDTLIYFHSNDENKIQSPPNVTLPETEKDVRFLTHILCHKPGFVVVQANTTDERVDVISAFLRIKVLRSFELETLSTVVGWLYFIAWSISFYPQVYENWRRKSVVGLNFDFLALNILGFFLYGIFNASFYWIKSVQDEYYLNNPTGVIPVKLNDVIFAAHALVACLITLLQCLIYERGSQTVSKVCLLILAGIGLVVLTTLILSIAQVVKGWILFLEVCSFSKLFITLIKYLPQAWMNYRRKSTSGWSIGNVLLDFSGGALSIMQMFLDAYNYDDWASIFGNPTKFGLGVFSISFDVIFILQHYVFYRNNENYAITMLNADENNETGDNCEA